MADQGKKEQSSGKAVKSEVSPTDSPLGVISSGEQTRKLRKEIVSRNLNLKHQDSIELAFLMGIEEVSTFADKIKGSEFPFFELIQEAEKTGKVKDDNVDMLIEALQTLSMKSGQCKKVLECVKKYNVSECEVSNTTGSKQSSATSSKENRHVKALRSWAEDQKKTVDNLTVDDMINFLKAVDKKKPTVYRYFVENISFLNNFKDENSAKVLQYIADIED